jgi:hypothetical protein
MSGIIDDGVVGQNFKTRRSNHRFHSFVLAVA